MTQIRPVFSSTSVISWSATQNSVVLTKMNASNEFAKVPASIFSYVEFNLKWFYSRFINDDFFIQNDFLILNAIGEDWKKTGRCDFAVAKEKFLQTLITAFALPKDSPYTYFFNREWVLINNLVTKLSVR